MLSPPPVPPIFCLQKQTLAQMKEEKDNIIQGHLDEIEVLRERAEKAEAEAASLKAELEALKGEVRPAPGQLPESLRFLRRVMLFCPVLATRGRNN